MSFVQASFFRLSKLQWVKLILSSATWIGRVCIGRLFYLTVKKTSSMSLTGSPGAYICFIHLRGSGGDQPFRFWLSSSSSVMIHFTRIACVPVSGTPTAQL